MGTNETDMGFERACIFERHSSSALALDLLAGELMSGRFRSLDMQSEEKVPFGAFSEGSIANAKSVS